ncbi:BSD domain-containing protein 1-like [Asparagus officinalis]|nr:BSD domain-containing protein 1-like [Asparagus officinalis]XP_020267267.1 BSD domain-containing protein 1-like [Asparagus officinalis]XP_020267269.1 BSD domain-containing protein 1-like [Asparagus officinalis]XP_020267270.1 BSD domain-containing protein 1-like [Asparagus officinalis]
MNFFKSVFSEDLEPSDPPRRSESPLDSQNEELDQDQEAAEAPETPNPNPNSPSRGAWSFGGLIKTIASRSESVIEAYRRDLGEFSTGLKNETTVFKEVASRAVRDLPGSLEIGASVAQESLESVGQAIDDFVSQGKEALGSVDSDSGSQDPSTAEASSNSQSFNSSKRFSRFEVQVLAIQNDVNTFTEEPEDGEDFEKWRSGFRLEEKEEDIEGLLYENGTLEGFFEKFVPEVLNGESFWARYFYRVYRLKQAEDARAKLVKRVIAGEEELSWEVDDSDESGEEIKEEGENVSEEEVIGSSASEEEKPIEETAKEVSVGTSEKPINEAKREITETSEKNEGAVKEEVAETSEAVQERKPAEASQVENLKAEKVKSSGDDGSTLKIEGKMASESKSEPKEPGKDSGFCVVSSQTAMQEEDDLGWDEINDLGEHEDKDRIVDGSSGIPKKLDLRKRLNVAEDDEDLSWDIEDDDEPAKP